MQIQLNQPDLEQAVRDFVAKMGIARPVNEITFATTRTPPGITAEIQLTDPAADKAAGPVNRAAEDKVASIRATRVSTVREETQASNEPEPAGEQEAPFVPDAASQSEGVAEDAAPAATGKKKLFS